MCSTLTGMKIHNGEIISDDWDMDGIEDGLDGDTLKKLPWLSDIDTSQCSTATIGKTESGRYLLIWKHRHREMLNFFECFPDAPPIFKITKDHPLMIEFQSMRAALPSEEFSKEITRKQAWETIAYFWLPEEWHSDAGIA
jgi:hypothetical protein